MFCHACLFPEHFFLIGCGYPTDLMGHDRPGFDIVVLGCVEVVAVVILRLSHLEPGVHVDVPFDSYDCWLHKQTRGQGVKARISRWACRVLLL